MEELNNKDTGEVSKEKLTVAGMILGGLAIHFVTIFGISFLLGGIIASILTSVPLRAQPTI